MISSPDRNDVAIRLSGYVAELQHFYQDRGLSPGSAADLEAGTKRLSRGSAFADELSATIRSIVYREHEKLTENDLTELILTSLAHGSLRIDAVELDEPKRRVHDFLATALRSFRRSSPNAPYQSRLSKEQPGQEPELRAAEPGVERTTPERAVEPDGMKSDGVEPPVFLTEFSNAFSTSELPEQANDREVQSMAPLLSRQFADPALLDDPNMASNQDAVAREVARMLAQDRVVSNTQAIGASTERPVRVIEEVRLVEEAEAPGSIWPSVPSASAGLASAPQQTTQPARLIQETRDDRFAEAMRRVSNEPAADLRTPDTDLQGTTKDEDGVFPEYHALPFFHPEHRTLWIVGICCLLLGLIVGLLARGSRTRQDNPVVNHEVAPGSTSRLKPSPYTLRLPGPAPVTATVPTHHAPHNSHSANSPAPDGAQVDKETGTLDPLLTPPVRVEGRNTAQAPTERYTALPNDNLALDLRSVTAGSASRSGTSATTKPAPGSASSPTGSVYLAAAGAMASNLLAAPAPAYPAQASAAGVQGRVVVQALVGRDGHVLDAHVTTGDRLLREAALEAVTRWRYRPFLEDGRPAQVETVAILDFKLSR